MGNISSTNMFPKTRPAARRFFHCCPGSREQKTIFGKNCPRGGVMNGTRFVLSYHTRCTVPGIRYHRLGTRARSHPRWVRGVSTVRLRLGAPPPSSWAVFCVRVFTIQGDPRLEGQIPHLPSAPPTLGHSNQTMVSLSLGTRGSKKIVYCRQLVCVGGTGVHRVL